jgi:RNA polymerase sigma-70 factor (ECF subfamily)
MFRIVQRYLVNITQAEDCVMRGMMKVFQQMDLFKFQGEHSLYLWSRRIIINEALMDLRKRNNIYLLTEEDFIELPDSTELLNEIDAEEILHLIIGLPVGYRTVFNLYVIEEFSHKEIAQMLGINESTSKTQYRKAKIKLKEMLLNNKNSFYGKYRK